MKLPPDDPKLTAYALGELDPSERAAVEAALANSPEARAAVEEIRETAGHLTVELAAEPCPGLTAAQRAAVATAPAANVLPFPWWRVWRTAGIAAAACLLALLGWTAFGPKPEMHEHSVTFSRTPSSSNFTGPHASLALAPAGTGFSAELWKGAHPDSTKPAVSVTDQIAPHPFSDDLEVLVADPANASTAGGSLPGVVVSQEQVIPKRPVNQLMTYSVNAVGGVDIGGRGFVAQTSGNSPEQTAGTSYQKVPVPADTPAIGATFHNGSQVQLREVRSGQDVSVLASATFSPDGRFVVTTSDDKNVRVWDARTGQPAAPAAHPIQGYAPFVENAFTPVLQEPLSTFSIDVDTASYANVRRFLNSGRLPPRDAVRIEELVNYFTYAYPPPRGDDPFSASIETAGCPWAPDHRLVRIALKGRELPRGKRPPSNFVFLIDVSGSMQPAERLPLLKQALRALVKKMTESDRVAIVVYASEAGLKLESTSCAEKEKILAVIDALEAGGSTNGGEGIQQAYAAARKNFIKGGVNRVLLCTDGDFNVGLTDQNALVALVKENATAGVFLTTLGVGTDNYKDALMQRLADKANGNYHYLDTFEEAQKVLIEQMNGTLVTIAKDVKIQVEFNPARVGAYRLIGYEKRMLRAPDFNNDRKDAGEIGAGHTVTAFYEIVPAGKTDVRPVVDKLKYQTAVAPATYSEKGEHSQELLTLKLRYKQPEGDTSKLLEFSHTDSGGSYGKASADFKFASAVAAFGMILRGSEHKGSATFDAVTELADEGKGGDDGGWRAEFVNLVKKAKSLGVPQ